MIVTLKRKATFSAAHSYFLPDLSEEHNRELFGAYAAGDGHGHNYQVEIAVTGPVDEKTGMVVNITDIDRALKGAVIGTLGGKFLNREVEYFRSRAPSTENIVGYVVDALCGVIPSPGVLTGVAVWESEMLSASWRPDDRADAGQDRAGRQMMVNLTRVYEFSASHRLHSARLSDEENRAVFGKCNNPNGHGHNYEIEVTIAGTPPERTGMVFSLDELDKIVDEEVVAPMDHRHLNYEVPEFENGRSNPTSEMLAVVIWRRLAKRLPTSGDPRLARVLVRETARNVFEYSGE